MGSIGVDQLISIIERMGRNRVRLVDYGNGTRVMGHACSCCEVKISRDDDDALFTPEEHDLLESLNGEKW